MSSTLDSLISPLIIDGGGRGHIILKKAVENLELTGFCIPGNAGTAEIGKNIEIGVNDFEKIAAFVRENNITYTIVGPEAPLANGIVDYFMDNGLVDDGHHIFGPTKAAAQIEANKAWAKELFKKYEIATASFEIFTDYEKACAYVNDQFDKGINGIVVKASGLAAGKGVTVAREIKQNGFLIKETLSAREQALKALEEIMKDEKFGKAGDTVVIEELMEGPEFSMLYLVDINSNIKGLKSSQDHKPIHDNDEGPNTGGMGAYAPTPLITPYIQERILEDIIKPTVKAMEEEGCPYTGCLYLGGMLVATTDEEILKNYDTATQEIIDKITNPNTTEEELDEMYKNGLIKAKVIEYNCRFGDPEAQGVIDGIENFLELIDATCTGRLNEVEIKDDGLYRVLLTLVSTGYPGSYEKGKEITIGDLPEGVEIIHAGTKKGEDGKLYTNGGRVLGILAKAEKLEDAITLAYESVEQVNFEGMYCRTDIGRKFNPYIKRI